MNDAFYLNQNNCDPRSNRLFECVNVRTVRYALESVAFSENQLWKKVPNHIEVFASLGLFKGRTELWNCKECPCNNICRTYISN